MTGQARVLIADDHQIVVDGLRSLLEDKFEIVGTVNDGEALIEAVHTHRPDVVVADLSMPVLNGIDWPCQLRSDRRGRQSLQHVSQWHAGIEGTLQSKSAP